MWVRIYCRLFKCLAKYSTKRVSIVSFVFEIKEKKREQQCIWKYAHKRIVKNKNHSIYWSYIDAINLVRRHQIVKKYNVVQCAINRRPRDHFVPQLKAIKISTRKRITRIKKKKKKTIKNKRERKKSWSQTVKVICAVLIRSANLTWTSYWSGFPHLNCKFRIFKNLYRFRLLCVFWPTKRGTSSMWRIF